MPLVIAFALVIGLLLGLLGGGGSILMVPMLTYVGGMDAKQAIATSLLVVGVTSAAAVLAHARQGQVVWRTGLVFGVSGMTGAYLGGRLAAFIPGTILLAGFSVMMLATGVAMLRGRERTTASGAPPERMALGKTIGHGLAVGAITGLVGAGGGFLVVPALALLGGMPMKQAVATSLLVIAMKSFAGFAGYAGHVDIDPGLTVWISAAAVIGSVFGGVLVKKIPQAMLRAGFAWLVIVMAVVVAAVEIPEAVRSTHAFHALLVERWPWWAGGAAIAAVVLGLSWSGNKQLGVSTGCSELCLLPADPAARRSWRPRFLLGIVLGGALAALLAGRTPTLALGGFDALFGASLLLKLAVLLGAGVLIGFGARLAGGCTSGHGIVGTALGARSSLVATALFMVAGFATTNFVVWAAGG